VLADGQGDAVSGPSKERMVETVAAIIACRNGANDAAREVLDFLWPLLGTRLAEEWQRRAVYWKDEHAKCYEAIGGLHEQLKERVEHEVGLLTKLDALEALDARWAKLTGCGSPEEAYAEIDYLSADRVMYEALREACATKTLGERMAFDALRSGHCSPDGQIEARGYFDRVQEELRKADEQSQEGES
jgi:hypothetical protein